MRTRDPKTRSTRDYGRTIDPNKRYMSCRIVNGKAFVDFINPRDDEFLQISVSFLKSRFKTKLVPASTDPLWDEVFLFEFVGENESIRFDTSMLLKLHEPLQITVLKHRTNEKPIVISTKKVEWRPLLYTN